MAESEYEKYAVREPIYEAGPGIKGRQSPTMTFMSEKQTGATYYIELGWIYDIPDPNPHIQEHVHDFDEIVLHWGGDYKRPQMLGGEIEFYVGGQPITFNTTTGIFIPAGVPHGPLTWKKFEFPHIEMAMMLGTGDMKKGWGQSGIKEQKSSPPEKTKDFDYEQYVIRSPMREAGANFTNGRQSPTMTYMSEKQTGAPYYIELGWIYDIPDPNPHIQEHVHDFDEIVLHWGGVGSRLYAFPATEFIDCHFPTEPLQHDTDLLFRSVLPPGLYPNLLNKALGLLGSGFGNISFIFVFLGHNLLLSLLRLVYYLTRSLYHPSRVYGFSGPVCVPLSLTVYIW